MCYPKGNGVGEGNSISLVLAITDVKTLPANGRVFAEFDLAIMDQDGTLHNKKCKGLTTKNLNTIFPLKWFSCRILLLLIFIDMYVWVVSCECTTHIIHVGKNRQ